MIAGMSVSAPETRAVAARVAKALREKGRTDEAIAVLSACAASGANDAEGQSLLAEALRIDQNSALARMAFERMEGVSGQHAPLEEAIARYNKDELIKLDRALKPSFRKAQVGFNNNLKYKGAEYHVQTEDSGLDKPHIITHLFADGGRVIKSHKRSYANEVGREDVAHFVRGLMKGQHMEMVLQLREGMYDEVIAGKARAGLVEVFETPPKVDVDRIGKGSAKDKQPAPPTPPRGVSSPQLRAATLRARLHVLRSLHGGPDFYDVVGDACVIGVQGGVKIEGEKFCHPREAVLMTKGRDFYVEDIDGGNGVFLRIGRRVEVGLQDEFIIGDSLLRLERNPEPNDGPDPGPTYFRSSLKWPSSFRVVQIFEGGASGGVAMARGATLQIGSANDYANDFVLRGDPLVAPYHCVIEEQAEAFILTDLGARSGVFVRVGGKQTLQHGSELLVGRTRLLVDLSPARADLEPLG
jgi:pSer/pThr/pTyr-binding forkhead associated (FHA) protein